MKTKICKTCDKRMSLDEFHKHKTQKDGRVSTCKECANARARKWTADNRQRAKERKKKYHQENAEYIKRKISSMVCS